MWLLLDIPKTVGALLSQHCILSDFSDLAGFSCYVEDFYSPHGCVQDQLVKYDFVTFLLYAHPRLCRGPPKLEWTLGPASEFLHQHIKSLDEVSSNWRELWGHLIVKLESTKDLGALRFLLLWKLAKNNLGLKGYEGSRQRLKQKSWRKAAYWHAQCFLIPSRTTCHIIHNGLGPPTPIISHRLATLQKDFLYWGSSWQNTGQHKG